MYVPFRDRFFLETKVWIFLCIEHGMLLFKYGLETLIRDTPADVSIQLKRNEFLVSKVSGAQRFVVGL